MPSALTGLPGGDHLAAAQFEPISASRYVHDPTRRFDLAQVGANAADVGANLFWEDSCPGPGMMSAEVRDTPLRCVLLMASLSPSSGIVPDQESSPLGDTDHRMRGEPSAPTTSQEAQHWLRLYREIVSFEESVLDRMREMQRTLPEDLREEAEQSNIRPMEELIAGYQERAADLEQSLISLMPDEERPEPLA
jgi:hypothetical protein